MQTQTGPQIGPIFIDCCKKCGGKGCLVRKRKRRKDAKNGHRWTEDTKPESALELMWSTPLYRFLIMDTAKYRVLFQMAVEINMVEGRA
jgi:hypothetical protein